ncbi:class I SAM-dependent methyltransferase [Paralimibaculum aggregatum]|uniref:Class I SAM-dependent methyltransferase n=1 Tax=Paralimibaculum aggregatum TaxID=3036245 RepID=A0ABQ6LI65_9RHOB|nr:class I SAM-dependent methyltransferase [Limibaculum sp. NKW23]GMG80878.1 class I SAM-dependent methyltransferase [Limibaculum sp. NKW23]
MSGGADGAGRGPAASPAHPPGGGGPAPAGGAAVGALFDRDAAGYDAERRRLVPDLDEFYDAGVAALGALPRGARVLDLGAGTGLFAARVALAHPGARLVLQDVAPGMLALAGARFAGLGLPAPETRLADMAGSLPEGRFDAVISALAIHHLEHPAQAALFRGIARILAPGGRFVDAEQILQPDPAAEAAADRAWEAAARAAGAGDAALAAARARMAHDRCATVTDLLAWLGAADFAAHCPWARGRFAVLAGIRQS